MADSIKKISTSAIARSLDLPVQQLFGALQDSGWIKRSDGGWLLTGKGEFEGGSYQDSERYGRYIVWPESLQQHPLIASIEGRQKLGAAGIARCFGLDAKTVNRALAEMGLQRHTLMGWEINLQGTRLGGVQQESENSGALFISWPRDIVDNAVIRRELEGLTPYEEAAHSEGGEDLFSTATKTDYEARDGHRLESQLEQHVCNWLYLAQLAHAVKRRLPVAGELYADFYLPGVGVYIECWREREPPEILSQRLQRQEVYREHDLRFIDVHERDINRLDEVMGRQLHEMGLSW